MRFAGRLGNWILCLSSEARGRAWRVGNLLCGWIWAGICLSVDRNGDGTQQLRGSLRYFTGDFELKLCLRLRKSLLINGEGQTALTRPFGGRSTRARGFPRRALHFKVVAAA